MTVAVIGIGVEAQETVHGNASNANMHLEVCCGGKHVETGERKVGAFYKTAAVFFGAE